MVIDDPPLETIAYAPPTLVMAFWLPKVPNRPKAKPTTIRAMITEAITRIRAVTAPLSPFMSGQLRFYIIIYISFSLRHPYYLSADQTPVLSTFIFLALFAVSAVIGKIIYKKGLPPWASSAVTVLLIFTISLWAGSSVPVLSALSLVLISLAFSLLITVITYLVGVPFLREKAKEIAAKSPDLKYFLPLVLGFALGELTKVEVPDSLIQYELYALAVVVGLDSGRYITRELFRSITALPFVSVFVDFLGAIVSALAFSLISPLPLEVSMAVALGSGWYSYTGTAVALHFGPYYGVMAFLVNFFREQLTFLLVPLLVRLRPSPVGAIAVGGATSMDVTLPFYVESLGPQYAVPSMVSGLIITFLVPVVVPLAFLV